MIIRKSIVLLILAVAALAAAFPARINGPTASFQVKWHVENRENNYCELLIKDFATASSDVLEGTTLSLAYTSEVQGLFTLQYRTNMIKQNHTLELEFTPLIAGGQITPLGFTVSYIIGEQGYLSYNSTTRSWTYDQSDNSILTGSFSVPYNQVGSKSSGPIVFLAQHPADENRPIVTKRIPVSLRLDDMNAVQDVTYVSTITIRMFSP